ncbi:glycosyltransferase [Vibrio crassostreae]|uniref:glycosyltransferase n=1 Tax=Vibrio crassostreae TaxID=246167 RepID=UPI0010E31385|nr:glycosyltransferase [Vibrio crassostreae]TCW16958.1 glycosyltransferase involved in cell wall biosynthesis [Vibrio crassostreae]CAK3666731.1 putative Glycosyl transferase family 1 domain-containing protein [Vibrio crassostreae]
MLYIDYTNSISYNGVKYHGGGNYTRYIIGLISNNLDKSNSVTVLIPNGYILSDTEINLFRGVNIKEVGGGGFSSLSFSDSDTIFFPLLNLRRLSLAREIRNKNNDIKIFVTIHGLRILDLKPDVYDQYYGSNYIKDLALYPFKCLGTRYLLTKNLKYFDRVFTDSNYALKQITNIVPNCNVKNFYLGIPSVENIIGKKSNSEDFLLFVSGGRAEKNLVRGVEGFISYIKENDEKLLLKVTGVNEHLIEKIKLKLSDKDKSIFEKNVICLGYVSEHELNNLYSEAYALFYLSKSEGFGLPLLEAAVRGTPTLASYSSSIPEVLGSACHYINAMNIEEISKGIEYIRKEPNYRQLLSLTLEKKEVLLKNSEVEMRFFINQLMME